MSEIAKGIKLKYKVNVTLLQYTTKTVLSPLLTNKETYRCNENETQPWRQEEAGTARGAIQHKLLRAFSEKRGSSAQTVERI